MSNPQQPLARYLIQLFHRFEADLLEQLRTQGFPTLTAGHLGLLRHLNAEGMRATDLARDASVSRQAATKMVQALEREGWIKRFQDPDDARSFRISYTSEGKKLMELSVKLVTEVEREFAQILGQQRYLELKNDLQRLKEEKYETDEKGAGS